MKKSRAGGKERAIVWFIGLSGSGKTVITLLKLQKDYVLKG